MSASNMETGKTREIPVRETAGIEKPDMESLDKPYFTSDVQDEVSNQGLSESEKLHIREETGWPDEIINAIRSMEEYEVYKKAGLKAEKVGDKICLIQPDIDMEQKDGFGRTNKERMEQGLAPLTSEESPYELHHIGQHPDSPLAELTMQEHRGKGNDLLLHDKTKESEIDRVNFAEERAEHWNKRLGVEIDE